MYDAGVVVLQAGHEFAPRRVQGVIGQVQRLIIVADGDDGLLIGQGRLVEAQEARGLGRTGPLLLINGAVNRRRLDAAHRHGRVVGDLIAAGAEKAQLVELELALDGAHADVAAEEQADVLGPGIHGAEEAEPLHRVGLEIVQDSTSCRPQPRATWCHSSFFQVPGMAV